MGINFLIVILLYLLVLVMTYKMVILFNSKDEMGEKIVHKALKQAFFILFVCLLVVFSLIILPNIAMEHITTAYLLLASKYISVLTLGGSIFILSRSRKNTNRNS